MVPVETPVKKDGYLACSVFTPLESPNGLLAPPVPPSFVVDRGWASMLCFYALGRSEHLNSSRNTCASSRIFTNNHSQITTFLSPPHTASRLSAWTPKGAYRRRTFR